LPDFDPDEILNPRGGKVPRQQFDGCRAAAILARRRLAGGTLCSKINRTRPEDLTLILALQR